MARSLEERGKKEEAQRKYRKIIDLNPLDYYSLWAWARLKNKEYKTNLKIKNSEQLSQPGEREILEAFNLLIRRHKRAFPWLMRAKLLWLQGDRQEAAEELQYVYIAYKNAKTKKKLYRNGIEYIWNKENPSKVRTSRTLQKLRKKLKGKDFRLLGMLAAALGDFGLSFRFFSPKKEKIVARYPLAYKEEVKKAAKRYKIESELIWAVMRVESRYQRQIVSRMGAIGLMQIMPLTGILIARVLKIKDFEPSMLFESSINIDFGAWYLKKLIKHFKGQIPLAVAAYNVGPHRVLFWLQMQKEEIEPDEFLESIPLRGTRKYVKRVLTAYTIYRVLNQKPPLKLKKIIRKKEIKKEIDF
jgi:soluble lytic murein transglycosylase